VVVECGGDGEGGQREPGHRTPRRKTEPSQRSITARHGIAVGHRKAEAGEQDGGGELEVERATAPDRLVQSARLAYW
jgi:hypothetical protein